MKKLFSLLTVAIFPLLLAACATSRYEPPSSYHIVQLPNPASTYLNEAQNSTGSAKIDADLLAATRMLQDGSTNIASQQIDRLALKSLSTLQLAHLNILKTYLALEEDKTKKALRTLSTVENPEKLTASLRLLYYQIANITYQRSNDILASIIARLEILQLKGRPNQASLKALWIELQSVPSNKLQAVMTNSSDMSLNAWLQLAIIAKQNSNNPQILSSKISQWRQQFPNSLANQLIPSNFTSNNAVKNTIPGQIALLLPMQSKFSKMGKAIRDGFLTNYYAKEKNLSLLPSIKIYDTTKQNITTLYQKVVANGAQVVIGPLLKSNVDTLINSDTITVPTITLNYAAGPSNSNHLIEFGLSPQSASIQAADKAWQYGVSKILIITPKSGWGNTVANAFSTQWKQLGGQIMAKLSYTNSNLQQQISSLLEINQSEHREKALQKALNKQLVFTPRRRIDANGVFLVAPPEVARQIKPLLKFYFAGSLPVFSTSLVYNGYQQKARNRDLNQIYFTSMPLLLSANKLIQQLREKIYSTWPSNYRQYNRLYGLGFDALTLALQFNRLTLLPNFGISGVTGRLYLKNHRIYRQLMWAQIKNGRAISVN